MEQEQQLYELCLSYHATKRRLLRRSKLHRLRLLLAACVLAVLLCLFSGWLIAQVRVKNIVFEGNARYSEDHLCAAIPARVGDRMYGVDVDVLCEGLLRERPYLKEVTVTTTLSGIMKFSVVEREPLWALALPGGSYAVLDEELQVLEMTTEVGELCVVLADGLPPAVVGESLTGTAVRLEEEAKEARRAAKEAGEDVDAYPLVDYSTPVQVLRERLTVLVSCFVNEPALSRPQRFSMTDSYRYVLWLRDGTQINLGGADSLSSKIAAAQSAIVQYREKQGGDLQTPLLVDARNLSRILVSILKPY